MVRVITLKANTELKMIVISIAGIPLAVTYAQAYTIAFQLLYLLGMVREVRPENEPCVIELFLPEPTPGDEDRILDPTRELVPDLEAVVARVNRHRKERS